MDTRNSEPPRPLSNRALEMIMRDVLDGLEDLAINAAWRSSATECRVVAISSGRRPRTSVAATSGTAQILDLRRYRRKSGR
jgi:hypothetical protein